MNELPRVTLCQLISDRPELCDDARALKGLLLDMCGIHRREVSALCAAHEEKIPRDLKASSSTLPKSMMITRLTARLYADRGLEEGLARWAVESWALALGKVSADDLISVETIPSPARRATPHSPAVPAARPARSRVRSIPTAPVRSSPSGRSAWRGVSTPPISAARHSERRIAKFIVGGAVSLAVTALLLFLLWPGEKEVKTLAPKPPDGMVFIPAGEFTMGNNVDGDELERPERKVQLPAFFIDKFEVTCADYAKFASANGVWPGTWATTCLPSGRERRPVTGLRWHEANAYALSLGKRLPTEAEWEYAARGNDKRQYPWGPQWRSNAANVGSEVGHIANVDQFSLNVSPFGVADMVGNVWEWTSSDLAMYSGTPLPRTIMRRGIPDEIVFGKVIRGGSWQSDKEDATTTYRRGYPPDADITYDNTGFRCVKEIKSAP